MQHVAQLLKDVRNAIQIAPASAAVSEADSIMGLVQGVLPALPSALICAMGTCTEFGTP